jgi:hypothetical protein
MKHVQVSILCASMMLCLLATLSVFQFAPMPDEITITPAAQAADLASLQREIDVFRTYGDRITRVEDKTESLNEKLATITWWARAIGLAFTGALAERLFRVVWGLKVPGGTGEGLG